jgi:hypothetical protein
MQTRGNFEVDIFDLIDVRGDLPDTMRLSKSRNIPSQQQQQPSFLKTSVKLLTPMGVEFRVEGKSFNAHSCSHTTEEFFCRKTRRSLQCCKNFHIFAEADPKQRQIYRKTVDKGCAWWCVDM